MKNSSQKIFLPGGLLQLNHLKTKVSVQGFDVLIIGSNSEFIAEKLLNDGCLSVSLIVNDSGSLLNSKIVLQNHPGIKVKMMSFENTDFSNEQFGLVYAQASVSIPERNKIIKEIKRILTPGGYFCVGEITSLKTSPPQFMQDVWEANNILPLNHDKGAEYYLQKGFEVQEEIDLSNSLSDFYKLSIELLKNSKKNLTDEELSAQKKLLNRLSHESNAYLKLGGKNYMGFKSLILRKPV
ncbi:MAG TPA: class I SAM-dependent methyltransferase [Ignavibacteriaceae bacterium]